MECEPSTKYGHSHQKRGCFSKKTCSPIDEQCEESPPFGWYIVTHQPENKGHVRMIPLRNQRHDVMVRPL